jgi:hypothetical protein
VSRGGTGTGSCGPEPACSLHVFEYDSPEPIKHRIFRDWLRANPDQPELYARTKREAAEAANSGGEHVMQYNACKEQVIREIYDRAFIAAGLLDQSIEATTPHFGAEGLVRTAADPLQQSGGHVWPFSCRPPTDPPGCEAPYAW